MSATYVSSFTRTHTATYVADKMRVLLTDVVREYGLDPHTLHADWSSCVGDAARQWMASGHLESISIEFFAPGSNVAAARWDFPIRYGAVGVDELWVDKTFLRDSIAKSRTPPVGCTYRVILSHKSGAAPVPGMSDCTFKDVSQLQARSAGTVISTPDINATARYYL